MADTSKIADGIVAYRGVLEVTVSVLGAEAMKMPAVSGGAIGAARRAMELAMSDDDAEHEDDGRQ